MGIGGFGVEQFLKGRKVKDCLPVSHGSRTFEVTDLTLEEEEQGVLMEEESCYGQGKTRPAFGLLKKTRSC